MLELALKGLAAYLLGSVMGGVLVARWRGTGDLRDSGSGNLGATNALRTQGTAFALTVLAIDIGKGLAAVLLLPALAWPAADPAVPREAVVYLCGLAVIAGHVWPLWQGFRGGKGAATAIGTVVVLAPALAPALLLVWLAIATTTGYVGLATVSAAAVAPLLVLAGYPTGAPGFVAYALPVALFIAWTHRRNLAALRNGTERRTEGLMLRRRGS